MDKLKAHIHVNEPDRWDIALGNVTNLYKDVGDGNAEVIILANGPSVTAYIDVKKLAVMEELSKKGAHFFCCRNSLKKLCSSSSDLCINEDSLPSYIHVVKAGITEIIRKQMEGYAYIKP
jgi:intracellular sulfur oxidation DsrE/DsrF family protein